MARLAVQPPYLSLSDQPPTSTELRLGVRSVMRDKSRTTAQWFREYRRYFFIGGISGILSGALSSYMTDQVPVAFVLIGAVIVGIVVGGISGILGLAYGYLLERRGKKAQ